jgi:hypothetical protein
MMSQSPRSLPAALGRVLRLPLLALAVLVVLVDDAFRAVVVPAVRALARLRLVQRLEAAIARLPAYGVLALFLVPLAILEPLKIYGLFLFGEGRFIAGILVFVVAKVVGLGLAERLFAIGREKLLSIGWFCACYRLVIAVRDVVHDWLEKTSFWPRVKRLAAAIRGRLLFVRAGVARMAAGLGGDGRLVAAARRQLFHGRE